MKIMTSRSFVLESSIKDIGIRFDTSQSPTVERLTVSPSLQKYFHLFAMSLPRERNTRHFVDELDLEPLLPSQRNLKRSNEKYLKTTS
jgi:hypothetical protein